MKRLAHVTLVGGGLAVSAVFTYLAVRGIDWGRFRAAIAGSNPWWLAPAFAVLLAGVVLRAIRWRLLFPHELRPPLAPTVRALLVGTFFNTVLPARPGEAIRVVTLHQETRTPRSVALGTAVTERIYDVLVLLVVFFVAVPWLPHVTWVRRAGIFAAVVTVALVAGLAVLARWHVRPLVWLLRPLARWRALPVERLEAVATELVTGLAAMRRLRLALPAILASFAAILVVGCSFWLVTMAFGLDLPFGAGLSVMVATSLAMVIPSSPAAIGVFEAATLVALKPFGVDHASALSYAVVLHALNSIPFVVFGLAILPRHGLQALRSARGLDDLEPVEAPAAELGSVGGLDVDDGARAAGRREDDGAEAVRGRGGAGTPARAAGGDREHVRPLREVHVARRRLDPRVEAAARTDRPDHVAVDGHARRPQREAAEPD